MITKIELLYTLWLMQAANIGMGAIINIVSWINDDWDVSMLFLTVSIYAIILSSIYVVEHEGIRISYDKSGTSGREVHPDVPRPNE